MNQHVKYLTLSCMYNISFKQELAENRPFPSQHLNPYHNTLSLPTQSTPHTCNQIEPTTQLYQTTTNNHNTPNIKREQKKMSHQDPHKPYLAGYKHINHQAYRTVPNSVPYLIPTLTTLASQNSSLTLLDVGAGPGTITADLALNYMPPGGKITAIDLSPEVIARASAHAENVGASKEKNIDFQAPVSVYDLSKTFGEGVFDVVHTHQMLTHLDDPISALREMFAVCKPGGVILAQEVDMRTWSLYPDTPTMRAWRKLQLRSHEAAGASKMAGPSLVSWAMRAGAKRGDIEASMGAWMYSTEEERQVWGVPFRDRITEGEMRKQALRLNLATEAEMDEMGAEWQRWIDTEDATCGMINGQIIVRKPL
jgi:2-polyprenyl-3-methyl-5-hydroxy-6-metoxy-1,4-benzoquinol methylase